MIANLTNQNMNMHITIKNALTGVKEVDILAPLKSEDQVDRIHAVLSSVFPDSFVNLNMGERGWIAGQPYNMAADERRVADGQMEWEAYVAKWYPTPIEK